LALAIILRTPTSDMSSSGESASPGVSSPGLPALAPAFAGSLALALAVGWGAGLPAGLTAAALALGSSLSLTTGAGLAAGVALAAGWAAAGLALRTGFFAAAGLAGAFLAGFACFLFAVLVATLMSTAIGLYIEASESGSGGGDASRQLNRHAGSEAAAPRSSSPPCPRP